MSSSIYSTGTSTPFNSDANRQTDVPQDVQPESGSRDAETEELRPSSPASPRQADQPSDEPEMAPEEA
jgi:hypothetical protein